MAYVDHDAHHTWAAALSMAHAEPDYWSRMRLILDARDMQLGLEFVGKPDNEETRHAIAVRSYELGRDVIMTGLLHKL